ncbi:hypothetical protein CHU92_08590 [Flavobacterium cyanobacteriorum]|uniref:YtxH domain-containing protein n=1 Tax=Flavobacterium cyanobacteriorum TaxID=2022802 RepID=A0A255Z726_9FLAO|nr:hypothetical protein [Flavobacterium cyanobacteriorum]OYQ37239.1 hypothetical protein CHU92_08590 [Flavobacterium cyanobacteriorum]
MSNKKVILGVAAGVAALAVAGVICKRKGYFDNLSTGNWGSNLKNKLNNLKDTAMQKMGSESGNGGETNTQGATKSTTGKSTAKKGNSMDTGDAGMNPATA